MQMTFDEWKELKYKVDVETLPNSEGYVAYIKLLGSKSFNGVGDTVEEALKELEDIRLWLYEHTIGDGQIVPLPEDEEL